MTATSTTPGSDSAVLNPPAGAPPPAVPDATVPEPADVVAPDALARVARPLFGRSPTRCPYCHGDVAPAEDRWVACAGCLARHHEDCWNENGRCSACGEPVRLEIARAATPARPRPFRSETGRREWATLVVSRRGDAPFRSIGDAVRAAEPGTRILIRPGVYAESLVLDKAVALVGEGPRASIVIEAAETDTLRLATERALVKGLTLRGRPGMTSAFHAVINLQGAGELRLQDCDLGSDSIWPSVAASGAGANAVLRGCRIQGGRGGGVLLQNGATGSFEGVLVEGQLKYGVSVQSGANPVFTDCTIRGCGTGLFATDGGLGTFKACELVGNETGVVTTHGGAPVLERCRIRDSRAVGVHASEQGEGSFDECRVSGSGADGVLIERGGNPKLRFTKVQENRGHGVAVAAYGQGHVEGGVLSDNLGAGLKVSLGGHPVVRRARIQRNEDAGVRLEKAGGCTVEECEIGGNRKGSWSIDPGARAHRRDNRD